MCLKSYFERCPTPFEPGCLQTRFGQSKTQAMAQEKSWTHGLSLPFELEPSKTKQSNFTPSSAAKPEAAIGAGPIKKCSEELNGKVDP